mgnify:CR=1 FL=1
MTIGGVNIAINPQMSGTGIASRVYETLRSNPAFAGVTGGGA